MHTPKIGKKALSSNDIAGSKKLSTFADAIVGIAEQNGQAENMAYIKQIKTRSSDKEYGRGNVLCTKIGKDEQGVLRHLIYATEGEDDVLDPAGAEGAKNRWETTKRAVLAYIDAGNYRQAAEATGLSKDKINRSVKKVRQTDPDLYEQLEAEARQAREQMPEDENLPF